MSKFWNKLLWAMQLGRHPNYTSAPVVAPPITHKAETKWTPISHNEPLRKTCGFVPPTPGYAQCTRPPHSSGPCAHPLLKPKALPRSTLYYFVAVPRNAILPQDDGIAFDVFVEATRKRDAIAKFNRYFTEFVYTEVSRVKP